MLRWLTPTCRVIRHSASTGMPYQCCRRRPCAALLVASAAPRAGRTDCAAGRGGHAVFTRRASVRECRRGPAAVRRARRSEAALPEPARSLMQRDRTESRSAWSPARASGRTSAAMRPVTAAIAATRAPCFCCTATTTTSSGAGIPGLELVSEHWQHARNRCSRRCSRTQTPRNTRAPATWRDWSVFGRGFGQRWSWLDLGLARSELLCRRLSR